MLQNNVLNTWWEDVQQYSSVLITILVSNTVSLPYDLILNWDNPLNGIQPNTSAPLYEIIVKITRQKQIFECNHRGRWFMLKYNQGVTISKMHRTSPSTINITDGTGVVNVKAGLSVVLSDISCNILGTTVSNINGNALYTTFADSNGRALATTSNCLSVSPCNGAGSSLLSQNNTLLCTNRSANNIPQGSTIDVSNACGSGRSLFLATDITSTSTLQPINNALCIALTNSEGVVDGLYIKPKRLLQGLSSFNIEHGINVNVCVNTSCILYDLYLYNDGPCTAWLLLYDANSDVPPATDAPKLSIPVRGHKFHDIVLPKGCKFNNGILLKASTTHNYINVSPGANVVFASGTFSTHL